VNRFAVENAKLGPLRAFFGIGFFSGDQPAVRDLKGWSPSDWIADTNPAFATGAWQKIRVNKRQEFVIGGYTPSDKNFDALVIGYYDGPRLIYAARTRNGFTHASRQELFKEIKPLETEQVSIRKFTGKEGWEMGSRLNRCKDGGMPVA
jgi:hypothetical protein